MPDDARTLKQLEGSVAVQVDDAERGWLRQVTDDARKQKLDRIFFFWENELWERIWMLHSGASPGPIGWRNKFI